MFVLARTVAYASLFVGVLLIYLPIRVLSWSGITPPAKIGVAHILGMVVGSVGAAMALWCILTFAFVGAGTPAPFDPPRRLVVRGPYHFVRNPMYMGGVLALSGAALFYRSWGLLAYAAGFFVVMFLFVVIYEEPALRTNFGHEYEVYCRHVGRWWPRV